MQVKMTEARRRGDRMESEQVIFSVQTIGFPYLIS